MPQSILVRSLLVVSAWIALGSGGIDSLYGQDSQTSQVLQKEKQTAQRFLKVLMRRPRSGTALDRVYGYHVRNDSVDELIESLTIEDTETGDQADFQRQAGAKTMILGLVHTQRGQPAKAAAAFERAEKLLPDDAACSFYLGRSLLAVGQIERAASAFENAIARRPTRNEALPMFTALGRLYGRAGQNEKALEVWKKLETMFPGDAKVGGQIARILTDDGFHEEALKRYETLARSSRRDDDKIAFAIQVAEVKRSLQQHEQATKDLEAILSKLRPGSWLYTDVRNRIENGFLKSGDFDALAQYYQKRLALEPDDLSTRARLGGVLVSAGRLNEAQKTLESAIERAPNDVDVRLQLIDVLVKKDAIASVAKQYEKLAQIDENNPDHLIRWGRVLLDDSAKPLDVRRSEAAQVWNRLAQARSNDAVMLSQVADKMRSIDQSDRAIELYQQAIKLEPTDPQYREYLGEFYHKLGRKQDAIKTWESIAENGRQNRESLIRLAEVFGTFDMDDRALETWREAAELDLNFAHQIRFAKLLRDAKKYDETVARLDAAAKIAETPDETEQLLRERIKTYQQSGTLATRIAKLSAVDPTPQNQRALALMYQAENQLTAAARVIDTAVQTSPKDVDLLVVAADIAEQQNRFADAAKRYRELASVDSRFRNSHLKKLADLQSRMGQTDNALATCEEMISANPASPTSYQFFARMAFDANRKEQGITALRRAMSVAPANNMPRRMLAQTLADSYRTDEAIELYWQSMQYETGTDARINLIRSLASLYDRKGDLESLLSRIEELGRDDIDTRLTRLLKAAAFEAIQDYGSARKSIDQLLSDHPRDIELLQHMVRLCEVDGEFTTAAELQQRITSLSDTPENRFQLIQLQLDAGIIDVKTALANRIDLVSDPVRLGGLIRSTARRGDLVAALAICRESLRRDDSLWDVKLMMIELLILTEHSNDESGDAIKEAIALADELRRANIAIDAKPPTRGPVTTSQQTNVPPPSYYAHPANWVNSAYIFARNFRIGRYASSSYSNITQSTLASVSSYGQAKTFAGILKMIAATHGEAPTERKRLAEAIFEEEFAITDLETIEDTDKLWDYKAIAAFVGFFSDSNGSRVNRAAIDRAEQLNWRLAELDPNNAAYQLIQQLSQRLPQMRERLTRAGQTVPDLKPLSNEQLERLVSVCKTYVGTTPSRFFGGSMFQKQITVYLLLDNEMKLAGKTETLEDFRPDFPGKNASAEELMNSIAFHLHTDEFDAIDDLMPLLLSAARADETSGPSRSQSIGWMMLKASSGNFSKLVDRYQNEMIDISLARWHHQGPMTSLSSRSVPSRGPTSGQISTYFIGEAGQYQQIQVAGPLSAMLFNDGVVSELASLLPRSAVKSNTLELPTDMIAHLLRAPEGASPREIKSRLALAAFADWWNGDPAAAYAGLSDACEKFPDDVDLQIERARLANVMGDPRKALDLLDAFDPLDSAMLVRKEMAAMNLSTTLGDQQRAKRAAERLLGLRIDDATKIALADQMKRLDMNDEAVALLNHMRGGRSRSRNERTELQIANALMEAGDKEAAGEVAYKLMRRLGATRSIPKSTADTYQRQAVSILKSVGRLDSMIKTAERRLKSAPKSMRARTELSDLYNAARRSSDANKLWEEIIKKNTPIRGSQLIAQAKSLSSQGKHAEAARMYLDAFEQEPSLLNQESSYLRRAVQRSGLAQEAYSRLSTFNLNSVSKSRIDELIKLKSTTPFSKEKRAFLAAVFQVPTVRSNIGYILRSVPESETEKIPAIKEALFDALTSPGVFEPLSNTWSIASWSASGEATGSLKPIFRISLKDEALRQTFSAAIDHAIEAQSTQLNARFLKHLLDLHLEGEKVQAAKDMRAFVERLNSDVEVDAKVIRTVQRLDMPSMGLLMQGGQLIETLDDVPDRTELLIGIYQAASQAGGNKQSSLLHPPLKRLISIYKRNDRNDEARDALLDHLRNTDFHASGSTNAGYADSKYLIASRTVANQLVELGYPIEALTIYQEALSTPEKFESSKQWSNRTVSRKLFETAIQSIREDVAEADALKYLQNLDQTIRRKMDANNDKSLGINKDMKLVLMEQASEIAGQDAGSTLAMTLRLVNQAAQKGQAKPVLAIGSVKNSNRAIPPDSETVETIRPRVSPPVDAKQVEAVIGSLLETLSQATRKSEHWTIPAAAAMVACYVDVDRMPEFVDEVFRRVPDQSKVEAESGNRTAKRFHEFIGLFPLAKIVGGADHRQAVQAHDRLVDYIRTVAVVVGDTKTSIALAQILTDEKSLEVILESIAANKRDNTPLPADHVRTCLELAESTAENGQFEFSARAIKLALGSGKPLQKVLPNESNDPFAIQPSRNRVFTSGMLVTGRISRSTQPSSTNDPLSPQVLQITKHYVDSTDITPTQIAVLVDALTNVLVPDGQDDVLEYSNPVVTASYYRIDDNNPLTARSLARDLGILAAKINASDKVIQLISKRNETASDKIVGAEAMLVIARESNDETLFVKMLDRFIERFDSKLPAGKVALKPRRSGSSPLDPKVQQSNIQTTKLVNTILHSFWPILNPKTDSIPIDDQTFDKILGLTSRTMNLIRSDSYISNRHKSLVTELGKSLWSQAVKRGNQATIKQVFQSEIERTCVRYSTYEAGKREQSTIRTTLAIVRYAIGKSDFETITPLVRSHLATTPSANRRYEDLSWADLLLDLQSIDEASRFEILKQITFGTDEQSPIGYFSGEFRYQSPPEILQPQTPRLAIVQSTPNVGGGYRFGSTILMLAELAAKRGESDSIADALFSRSDEAGDAASLAAAIVRVAATNTSDEAKAATRGILNAIVDPVTNSVPTKQSQYHPFPELEFLLVMQIIDHGARDKELSQLLSQLQQHAVYANRHRMVSAINQRIADLDQGNATGAQPRSPLAHFVSVPLPDKDSPDEIAMAPRYAIDSNQAIRSVGGYDNSMLLMRYPVVGDFECRFDLHPGAWADATICYGGVSFIRSGSNQRAIIDGIGNRNSTSFPAPSAKMLAHNFHSVAVSPQNVVSKFNGDTFATDLATHGHPFLGIRFLQDQAPTFDQLKIIGKPRILREVNLLDATLRGWSDFDSGRSMVSARLPLASDKDNSVTVQSRKTQLLELQAGPLPDTWSVHDGKLNFVSTESVNSSNSRESQIQYLRPLFDNETISGAFWWKNGSREVYPSIGRVILELSPEGTRLRWKKVRYDLLTSSQLSPDEAGTPLQATDNVVRNNDWNTFTLRRSGDTIFVSINSKPLVELPCDNTTRFGLVRPKERSVLMRDLKLTGDWPEVLPVDLFETR